jgi:hypothetical protein
MAKDLDDMSIGSLVMHSSSMEVLATIERAVPRTVTTVPHVMTSSSIR